MATIIKNSIGNGFIPGGLDLATADARFVQKGAIHINLADHLDGAASDHRADFKALIEGNGAGYSYFIPDGFTLKLPLAPFNTGSARPPSLPAQTWIRGAGPGSTILVTGFGANPGSAYAGLEITYYNQAGDVANSGIEHVTIQGDGPGAAQTWTNRQAAAVRVVQSTYAIERLTFRHVVFRDIDGFPLHSDGNDTHMLVERCDFANCGNGLNVNGLFTQGSHNYFTNSEGIESSSLGGVFDANVFEDIFSVALSLGGNGNTRAYPGTRATNNQVFGVRGGGSYGSGIGIITAESSPDIAIIGNYVERTYSNGYQIQNLSAGPDDGATLIGNHAVNCSTTGGSRNAYYVIADNVRFLGNRAYNRTALAGDPFDVTGYAALYGLLLQNAANAIVDDNSLDMSNGGNWAADISGATNVRWGTNRLVAGSSGLVQVRNSATFADAERLGDTQVVVSNNVNAKVTDRRIIVTTAGAARNVALFSAVGLSGKRLQVVVTDGATNPLTVTPNGTQTINGVNAAKTLASNYAGITLVSDGSNWLIDQQIGTVS